LIRGRAASNEAIQGLMQEISDCQIVELEWDDNTSIMPTTRVPPVPESLGKHVEKFLGKEVGIVGYWFGSLSVPGSVRAPIGPWIFSFEVDESERDGELKLDLAVEEERKDGEIWEIISNSIHGKIGRPVIIGYNRDNRGVRTMGALVVIPEPLAGI
jgi:hypothetical protein